MIQTEWFTFAAPPKCGNQWIKAVLHEQRIEWTAPRTNDIHHPGSVEGLPSITIQRPPHDWLYSYYLRVHNKVGVPVVDAFHETLRTVRINEDTFDFFALRYIDLMPGRITRMFEQDYKSTITLFLDNLPLHAALTFSSLNVPCDLEAVQAFKPVDVTKDKKPISDDLRLAIMEVG